MLVCHCYAVTDGHIREIIEAGAADVFDVAAACGAGSGCGGCLPRIQDLLAEAPCPPGVAMPRVESPVREPDLERARPSA